MKRLNLPVLMLLLAVAFGAPQIVLGSQQAVTITLPAEILHRTIVDALPIPLETQKEYLDGNVFIESLETLKIGENVIHLKGVVRGDNLTVNTNIAGQSIKLRLGSVRLPMTCDLFLRFDAGRKTLFVTPRFPKPKAVNPSDPADALQPLLMALGGREHAVNLDSIQPFDMELGKKKIPFKLEPAAVGTSQGMLVFKLKPKVVKRQTGK